MFGQIFASPSLGERTRRSRPSAASGRRNIWIWASTNLSSLLGRKWDRLFAAAPSAPPRRLRTRRVGIFFYLAGVALVGTIIIGVFFGVGLYSLAHPTEGTTTAVGVRHDEVAAQVLAMPNPSSSSGVPDDMSKGAATVSQPNAEPSAPESRESPAVKRPEPTRFEKASAETVSGGVIEVPDAMTWVVADRAVQLWGIRPGPPSSASSLLRFVDWVRGKGPVACHKHAHSSRYRCSTATGEDIAEAALLGGVGRAADGATLGYRNAEALARKQGRGLWAKL